MGTEEDAVNGQLCGDGTSTCRPKPSLCTYLVDDSENGFEDSRNPIDFNTLLQDIVAKRAIVNIFQKIGCSIGAITLDL